MTEKEKCPVCEKVVSSVSAARTSHYRKHVRDGSMREFTKNGHLYWEPTGTAPQEQEKPYTFRPSRRRPLDIKRRKLCARFYKKQIQIKCHVCGKWNPIRRNFVDNRFVASGCCGAMGILSVRDIQTVQNAKKEITI